MTQQDLQPIDVEYSATHSEDTVQDTVQCTVQSDDCTVQSEPYAIGDLIDLLKVKRRMVFTYAKTICEAHYWEPETAFKPVFGKYSQRALDEMLKLQKLGAEEYLKSIRVDNQKPAQEVKEVTGGLACISDKIRPDENSLAILESKILNIQTNAITETNEVAEELKKLNANLALQRKRSSEAMKGGSAARIARLKARAVKRAIEDFNISQTYYNSTIEELEIQELGE